MSLTARGPADISTGPAVSLFALLLDKLTDSSKGMASEFFCCAHCGEAIAPRSSKGDFRSPRPTVGASLFEKGEPSMVTVSNPLGVAVSLVTLQPCKNVRVERSSTFENSWFQGYLSARVACPSQRCRETLGWALACGSKSSSKRTPRGKGASLFTVDPKQRPVVFACAEDAQPQVPVTPRSNITPRPRRGCRRRSDDCDAVSRNAHYSHGERSMTLGEIAAKAKEVETPYQLELLKPLAEVQSSAVTSPVCKHYQGDILDKMSEASACTNSNTNSEMSHVIPRCEETEVPVVCKSNSVGLERCGNNPGSSVKQPQLAASAFQSCKSTGPPINPCRKAPSSCDETGQAANQEQVAKPSSRSCQLIEPPVHSSMKASALCHSKDRARAAQWEELVTPTPRSCQVADPLVNIASSHRDDIQSQSTTNAAHTVTRDCVQGPAIRARDISSIGAFNRHGLQVQPPETPRDLPRPRHFNPSRNVLFQSLPTSAGGSTLVKQCTGIPISWLPRSCSSENAPPAVQSAR